MVLVLLGSSPSTCLVGFVEAGSLPFTWLLISLARICTGRGVLALFFPPGFIAGGGRVVVLLLLAASDGPLDRGWGFPRRMFVIVACKASPFFSTARRSCMSVVAASRLMYPLTIRSASAKRKLKTLASLEARLADRLRVCLYNTWMVGWPCKDHFDIRTRQINGWKEGQEPASAEDWGGMSK